MTVAQLPDVHGRAHKSLLQNTSIGQHDPNKAFKFYQFKTDVRGTGANMSTLKDMFKNHAFISNKIMHVRRSLS